MDKWRTALGDGALLSDESYKMMTINYSGTFNYGYGYTVRTKTDIGTVEI